MLPRAWTALAVATVLTLPLGCAATRSLMQSDLEQATDALREDERLCAVEKDQPSCFYRQDRSGKNEKLIIFVHGVLGGAPTTWGNPHRETFWPAMVVTDGRFIDFDVYLINYITPALRTAPNIYETAANELALLEGGGVFSRYREIHFIAHSMGGLVVKNVLIRLRARSAGGKLGRVKSIVYLSTPAQGASLASIGAWFGSNPQFKGMEPAHLNESLQKLEDDWIRLMQARDVARTHFPRAYCAYETLETGPVLVVPREMASSRCDGDFQPMPFDHLGIAEPTRPQVNPYLWTMENILSVDRELSFKRKADGSMLRAEQYRHSGRPQEARAAYTEAQHLYKAAQDTLGEAHVLRGLGDLEYELGRNDQARAAYIEARFLYKAGDNRLGEAQVLRGLGNLETGLGRPDQARAAYAEARGLFKAIKDPLGEAHVVSGLASLEYELGRRDEARTAYTEALALYKALEYRLGEANVLLGIGDLERTVGRNDDARAAYVEARILYKAVGNRLGEANVLSGLGDLEQTLGRMDQARAAYAEALTAFKAIDHRLGAANVLSGLGELEHSLGRNDQARVAYTEARNLFRAVENRLGEANVLLGLARLHAGHKPEIARQHYYQAAGLYEAIGMAEQKDIALGEARKLGY